MSNVGSVQEPRVKDGTHESNLFFNRAQELVNRSRFPAARRELEKALRICPRHSGYLSLYGLCLAQEKGNYEAARRYCESAIKMNPGDPVPRVNLGKVLRLQGDNRGAHEELIAAWKLDKHHPAPATELSRMGIRRPPVLAFLPRSHWLNVVLGRLRARVNRLGIPIA